MRALVDMAGMPLSAWLLLALSVGLGLGVEVMFIRARRRDGVTAQQGGEARTSKSDGVR